MDFADWLREQLRARPDLNQARLAEELGIYASTVHYWVKGRSQPDDTNIAKLAEIFRCDPLIIYQLLGRIEATKANNIDLLPEENKIFNDLIMLRDTRIYDATIAAMKAVLVVATQEADAPDH